MGVFVRPMEPSLDLPALQELSPKPAAEFYARATLVAVVDGVIAGYTQFSLGPDGVLHSMAIRIGAGFKGQGIGKALMDAKVALAREVGATMHIYAIMRDGEEALKKIVLRQGMHLCQERGDLLIYSSSLSHA